MLGVQFHLRDDTEVVCLQGFAPGVQRYPSWPWYRLGSLTWPMPEVLLQKVALPNLSSTAQAGLALMWWIRSRNWSGSELSCQKGRGKGLFSASRFPREAAPALGNWWKQSFFQSCCWFTPGSARQGNRLQVTGTFWCPGGPFQIQLIPPSLCPCCSHNWAGAAFY